MKPRKDMQKGVQELIEQIKHIIGKDPKKAARAIELWAQDHQKPKKKAS